MPRPQVQSLVERLCPNTRHVGRGVCVAIIDSGFFAHPDLMRPVPRVRAYIDAAREGGSDKDLLARRVESWHGTMVACCAAGNGYLSGGRYRSLASGSDVVLVRAADERGRIRGVNVARGLRSIVSRPELGVRVISVSLGVDSDDPDAHDVIAAVDEAVAAGIVVVAAAGNHPGAKPTPPGSATRAITVGGVNDGNSAERRDDAPWPSAHGPNAQGENKPDLLAPSILVPAPMVPGTLEAREAHALYDLLTVLEEAALEADSDGRRSESATALLGAVEARIETQKYIAPDYQHVDGTSFAAPVVASIVAQMLEADPTLSPALVRRGLVATARRLPGVSAEVQGAGVVDASRAVEWAAGAR